MTTPDLPHLVDRWAEGFARSRQVAYARYGDVIEVEVDGGGRRLELVLTEPARELLGATAARAASAPDVWVTAFSVDRSEHPAPEGMRMRLDGEVLMSRALAVDGPAPDGVDLEVHGKRLQAVVRAGDEVAASGWVTVLGEHAIVDRVGTAPAHRRRGHASRVMSALERWACENGARTGLLAASPEGQALYASLGWDVTARMTTWCGRSEAQDTP
ncbi:GNAT family N-acetyltransferase [Nocardioides lijunqiniae]|uniref:GNAT family N-acetyltransferase n=1 Tax=Nocardioides lijunqiniae TaxID=2760832 RepID=UPI001878D837|nr:GNAT family N-acetyltransferase [Nocardioides lijunqiniae]